MQRKWNAGAYEVLSAAHKHGMLGISSSVPICPKPKVPGFPAFGFESRCGIKDPPTQGEHCGAWSTSPEVAQVHMAWQGQLRSTGQTKGSSKYIALVSHSHSRPGERIYPMQVLSR